MNQKLQKIFVTSVTIPENLEDRIIVRVKMAARRKSIERVAVGTVVSIVLGASLVVAGREIAAETAISGFGQYLSLIFTSGGLVLSDWRDFAWTIVESAPIAGFAICLGATGLFIAAIRWTGRAFGQMPAEKVLFGV